MSSIALDGRIFLHRLDKDRYCDGCLQARQAPDYNGRVRNLRMYYVCSACRVSHPACLFLPHERRVGLYNQRRCIAHQGYIRVCGHKEGIVRWSDVLNLHQKSVATRKTSMAHRCLDISHLSLCGKPSRICSAGNSSNRCHVHSSGDTQARYPCLNITRSMKTGEERKMAIEVSWEAHIPLGRIGEWPPTASGLRRCLTELRDNAGRFMTLTSSTQQLPELRCLDPNDCDCVYFEGSEDVDWRPYQPLQQPDQNKSMGAYAKCFPNPERRLTPFPQRRRRSPSTRDQYLEEFSSGPIRVCPTGLQQCMLAEKVHAARFNYQTQFKHLYGPGEPSISMALCHSDSPCFQVTYQRSIAGSFSLDGNIPESWYHSLDPDSYKLTSDMDGYQVYWCREPNCLNYYRNSPGFGRLISGYRHLMKTEYLERIPYHKKFPSV